MEGGWIHVQLPGPISVKNSACRNILATTWTRWLTVWGLIGVVPYLANALLHFFHVNTGLGPALEIPLALQELVMGGWLVIKGFNQAAVRKLNEAH